MPKVPRIVINEVKAQFAARIKNEFNEYERFRAEYVKELGKRFLESLDKVKLGKSLELLKDMDFPLSMAERFEENVHKEAEKMASSPGNLWNRSDTYYETIPELNEADERKNEKIAKHNKDQLQLLTKLEMGASYEEVRTLLAEYGIDI